MKPVVRIKFKDAYGSNVTIAVQLRVKGSYKTLITLSGNCTDTYQAAKDWKTRYEEIYKDLYKEE